MDKLEVYAPTKTIEGVGTIYKPTIQDVLNFNGEEKYNDLIIPFLTTIDVFDIPDDFKSGIKTFDLFFFRKQDGNFLLEYKEKPMIEILIEALLFFFRNEINLVFEPSNDTFGITIGDKNNVEKIGVINRNNFDNVSDLILEINNIKRAEIEKPPENMSERQRDVYNKLMEGRKRKETKDKLTLYDIISVAQHGGKSFVPYKEIVTWTIPQLYNTYAINMNMEVFHREFDKYCAGAELKDLDLRHWTERLKEKTKD